VIYPSNLTVGGVEKHVLMSDILFMSVKEHAAKKVSATGTASTVTNVCTLTASSGKDLYLASAQFTAKSTSSGVGAAVVVVLKLNGSTVETHDIKLAGTSDSEGEFNKTIKFNHKGDKVTTTQTITIDITSVTTVTVNGQIEGFEEDTGVSPFVIAEFQ